MLLYYIKIAWRNLRRNPVFALISIAGLALGSCICLVVWLVCSYEFSFDTFHPNRDRIYRLTSRTDYGPVNTLEQNPRNSGSGKK